MLNAWRCIGPGTAEREEEACSSCPAVVLHEPGSSGRLLANVHSPQILRDQGCCMLHALDSMRPATRAGLRRRARFLANIVEAAWTSRTSAGGDKACLTCSPPRPDKNP